MKPQRSTADQLLEHMEYMSEDMYMAGWAVDLEYALFRLVLGGDNTDEAFSSDVTELRALWQNAMGWWAWERTSGAPVFVHAHNWVPMFWGHVRDCGYPSFYTGGLMKHSGSKKGVCRACGNQPASYHLPTGETECAACMYGLACARCGHLRAEHVQDKCLFDSSRFDVTAAVQDWTDRGITLKWP